MLQRIRKNCFGAYGVVFFLPDFCVTGFSCDTCAACSTPTFKLVLNSTAWIRAPPEGLGWTQFSGFIQRKWVSATYRFEFNFCQHSWQLLSCLHLIDNIVERESKHDQCAKIPDHVLCRCSGPRPKTRHFRT